jgi:hypothetical protein
MMDKVFSPDVILEVFCVITPVADVAVGLILSALPFAPRVKIIVPGSHIY